MTTGLNEIIAKLEQQAKAIERALAALREVEGSAAGTSGSAPAAAPAGAGPRKATKKGGMTPEGRRRLSEALRARWAAKRTGSSVAPQTTAPAKAAPAPPAKAKKKGGMTPEGRRRLSEALRKRWAAKRTAAAAAPAKRAGRK